MNIDYKHCPYCQSILEKQTYYDDNLKQIVEWHLTCGTCNEFECNYAYGKKEYILKDFKIDYIDYIYSQKTLRKIENLINEILLEQGK